MSDSPIYWVLLAGPGPGWTRQVAVVGTEVYWPFLPTAPIETLDKLQEEEVEVVLDPEGHLYLPASFLYKQLSPDTCEILREVVATVLAYIGPRH